MVSRLSGKGCLRRFKVKDRQLLKQRIRLDIAKAAIVLTVFGILAVVRVRWSLFAFLKRTLDESS